MNELCSLCDEWIEGRCGGMENDPGGCWVEMHPTGDDWDEETGQMVEPDMLEDLRS